MDDVKENLSFFILHVQNGALFWNFLWDYFGLSKWKPKKISTSLQLNLRMPKLQATFKPLVAIVCHERQFGKMFSWLFCFVQVKALKSFLEKLYTSTIKKKRRSRGENCLHSCATSLFFITFWRHLWSRRTITEQTHENVESITVKLILYHEKCRLLAIITKLINKSSGK